MEAKINIAEILKNKPEKTILYDAMRDINVSLYVVEKRNGETNIFCDGMEKFKGCRFVYSDTGADSIFRKGMQLLKPSKEMRDWSKFAWKKGDVLVHKDGTVRIIFEGFEDDTYRTFKGKYYLWEENGHIEQFDDHQHCMETSVFIKANDDAKTYISTIEKKLGGKLNLETLEIEPAQPEFKDGDILSCDEDTYTKHTTLILHKNGCVVEALVSLIRHRDIEYSEPINKFLLSRLYYAREDEKKELFDALAKEGKAWDAEKKQVVDLKPKWTPKPFDKVLVRDSASDKWRANLFGYIGKDGYYCCAFAKCIYCIPYEGNEHLLGTTKDVEG